MAIITRIREKSGLIVGTIGVAILLFLIMDVFTGKNGLFGGKNTENIGEINGEEISAQLFQAKLEEAKENYKANAPQAKIDENVEAMLRDQVWNELLREKLSSKEYDELGIMVSEDELFDMVQGNNIHPSIKQAFTNPQTGQFDKAQVIGFLKKLNEQPEDVRKRWLAFEKYIYNDRMQTKYNTLISKGLYATKFAVENYNRDNNTRIKARAVFSDYMSIADSTIKVSDEELANYFNEHKKDFEVKEANRSVDYVVFDILPSSADSAELLDRIAKEKAELAVSTNDSAYVALNSELPVEDRFYSRKSLTSIIADSLFSGAVGSVYGPYQENGYYKISKISAKAMRADSVQARHILIKPKQGEDPALVKAKADSLAGVLRADRSKFPVLATQLSEDPGSAQKGGDLGKFAEGMMVKPFNDACFNGNKGDIVVVESQFGFHIIEITENNRTTPSVKVSTIARKIEASENSSKDMFAKANKFASTLTEGDDFTAKVEKAGLVKRTAETVGINDRALNGVPDTRAVVRWAFEAEKGDISKVFDTQNAYIIATVTGSAEKNSTDLESSRKKVEEAVRKEKKAEQLIAKMEKAVKSANGNIDAVATSLNTVAQPLSDITFGGGFLPAFGRELSITGAISTMKPGKLSKPLKGERGIYVVIVDSVAPAAGITDFNGMKTMVMSTLGNRAYEAFNALKEKATIEDRRYMFY